MQRNTSLLYISYRTCPTVYVNRHISCLAYDWGRKYARTRNLRISKCYLPDTLAAIASDLDTQVSKIRFLLGYLIGNESSNKGAGYKYGNSIKGNFTQAA